MEFIELQTVIESLNVSYVFRFIMILLEKVMHQDSLRSIQTVGSLGSKMIFERSLTMNMR